jgi:two-component sensor histidine kinase
MERVLAWLPKKPQHILVRYGATTILVAVCYALMRFVEARSGISCFFLMYPAVFLAAIAFDRGSGFLATGLSTALLIYSTYHTPDVEVLPQDYWLPVTLFFLVGLGLAAVSEMLRKGWERAVEAERLKDLLYRELGHRTKNDLAMASSVLMLQARSQSNPEVKSALMSGANRLNVLGRAHEQFDPGRVGEAVRMHDYLKALCDRLTESVGLDGAIVVRVDCDAVEMPTARAIPVGLIANELLTNAYKHAFSTERKGNIVVSLRRGQEVTLIVEDDGVGCAEGAASGLGSQLVDLLVRQLNGTMQRTKANPGCRVRVQFPETTG